MLSNQTKKESRLIGCFLFCPLLLLLTFGIYPIFALIEYSFTSWNGLSPTKTFVGFSNYIKILSDPSYIRVFLNCMVYFVSGLIQIVIALYFAILLSTKVKGKNFFKASFVFPSLISGMAVAMLFRLFFSPGGSFDSLLTVLGLGEHTRYWLGDPRMVNYTLGAISIWRHTGKSFILYFGAVQCIPLEHYRLAEIEGASGWQKVRMVILPGIQIVLKINFILLTIGAISAFELPLILTNGSNGTMTFLLQTMKAAFEKKMFGLAASMAVIVSLVILVITVIQNKLYKGEEDD
ncbi:sugar ABC transporter permease [Niameybacter massiliensis]|uniref:Sugar ABC transporter permease n=1 Tax=Holtiella tumoricola TaxID=3018743 RepID=A0AA42DKW5_9FIRM|nr:sugar ABC transporter permease [Holtiella tumoricola]MDA3730844.1 sugar ABC transporter permease [Holtiella tumoricola]